MVATCARIDAQHVVLFNGSVASYDVEANVRGWWRGVGYAFVVAFFCGSLRRTHLAVPDRCRALTCGIWTTGGITLQWSLTTARVTAAKPGQMYTLTASCAEPSQVSESRVCLCVYAVFA